MIDPRCPAGYRFLIQFPEADDATKVTKDLQQMFGRGIMLNICVKPGSNPKGTKRQCYDDEWQDKGFTVYVKEGFTL